MNYKRILIPLLIIVVGLVAIFFQYTTIPGSLAYDEVAFAQLALSLGKIPYIVYSPLATGHATMYFYILLASLKIFGISTFALRLPSAVFGIAGIILFYFIMSTVFKKNALVIIFTSLLFATSRWYINFARFSFESTFLLFLELSALFFLLLYLRKHKGWFLIGVGIFSGLATQSYYPGKIFFLIPLFVVSMEIILEWKKSKKISFTILKPLFVFGFFTFLFAAPLLIYHISYPDIRIDQQLFLLNQHLDFGTKINMLTENIGKIALMFNVYGDANGRHNYPGKPALNLISGILFLCGFLIAIRKSKHTIPQIFLLYFVVSLIPSIFTYPSENPHFLRTFTVLPSLWYFVGLSLHYILSQVKTIRFSRIAFCMLCLIIGVSIVYDLRTYFVYQTKVFPEAFEVHESLINAIRTNPL